MLKPPNMSTQALPGTRGVVARTPSFMPAAIHARGTHSPRAPPFRALCAPRPPRAPRPGAARRSAGAAAAARGRGWRGAGPGAGGGRSLREAGRWGAPAAGSGAQSRGHVDGQPAAGPASPGGEYPGAGRAGRGAGRRAPGTTPGRSLRAPAAALGGAGARGPRAGRGGWASAAAVRVRPEDVRKAGAGSPAEPTPLEEGGRPQRGRRAGRRLDRGSFPSVGRKWARASLGHLPLRRP